MLRGIQFPPIIILKFIHKPIFGIPSVPRKNVDPHLVNYIFRSTHPLRWSLARRRRRQGRLELYSAKESNKPPPSQSEVSSSIFIRICSSLRTLYKNIPPYECTSYWLEAPQLHAGLYPETGLTTIAYISKYIYNTNENAERTSKGGFRWMKTWSLLPPFPALFRDLKDDSGHWCGRRSFYCESFNREEQNSTNHHPSCLKQNSTWYYLLLLNSEDIPTKMFGYNSSWSHGLSLRFL